MPAITVYTTIEATAGGEVIRYSGKRTLTTGDRKYDLRATVADDNTIETLWTSNVHNFEFLMIVVDPDNDYEDGDAAAELTIELAGSSYTQSVRVRREVPFMLGANDLGDDIDSLDQVIQTIKAKNENADGVGDVDVRLILFSPDVAA